MIRVDLPGLTVTNQPNQYVPYLMDTNWFDSAESVIDADDRSSGEGSFDVDMPQIRPRFDWFTIGLVDPGDGSAVFVLHDIVMALQELIDPFEVTVTDPRGSRSATEWLAGKIEFPIEDEDGVAQTTIPLKAADPKRYGPLVTPAPVTGLPKPGGGIVYPIVYPIGYGAAGDPGRLVLTNPGTAATIPDLLIDGGLGGGFQLDAVETADRIRFERVIPDGSTVTLHQSENQASIDGDSNIVSTFLTQSDLIVVPPRGTVTIQFNSIGTVTGTPRLRAVIRPAYR